MPVENKKSYYFRFTPYLPLLGFTTGVLLWFIDAYFDSIVHKHETMLSAVIPHEMNELWARCLVIIMFTAGGWLGRSMVTKLDRLNNELTLHKEHLEDMVRERTQELEANNKTLQELSTTDPLTGLHNRRYFQHALNLEIYRYSRNPAPLSLLMFDIDHFKQINDEYGHHAGDVVLVDIASMFRQALRRSDTFARWGGEEFMILLPGTDAQGALKLAEKLRRMCAQNSFEIDQAVTISVGTVEYNSSISEPEFVDLVDQALYRAKGKGRNRVEAA